MSYVIQINFDSNWNLAKTSYVFSFRGREYRFLRGKRRKGGREKDCILSILNKDDEKEYYQVHRDIMIYCSCLAWERRAAIIVDGGGGYGTTKELTIRKVRRVDVTLRTMPVMTYSLSIERIPYVYNRDQEDAIGLYREAFVSNSPFYKFLCLWNILNIPTRKTELIIQWINETLQNKKSRIFPNNYINKLEKKSINIGGYLDEECRDAIAHIRRRQPNRTHIDPNNAEDYSRIASSAYLLEDLVRIYIREALKLNENQFLFKLKQRDIPEYLTEREMRLKIGIG